MRNLGHLATFGNLGSVERPGDPVDQAHAIVSCEEALRVSEEAGDQVGRVRALHTLAYVVYKARDYPRAARLTGVIVAEWCRQREIFSPPAGFEDVADIAGMTGRATAAARLYGAAAALRERLENPIGPFFLVEHEREVAVSRAALGAAAFAAAWAAGPALPLEETMAQALTVADECAAPIPPPAAILAPVGRLSPGSGRCCACSRRDRRTGRLQPRSSSALPLPPAMSTTSCTSSTSPRPCLHRGGTRAGWRDATSRRTSSGRCWPRGCRPKARRPGARCQRRSRIDPPSPEWK